MDTLVGILLIAGVVAVFVVMVRRANAKGRELKDRTTVPQPYEKPTLLTKAQRKALKLRERAPSNAPAKQQYLAPDPKPQRAAMPFTRAIRTGWSMGEIAFTYEGSIGEVSYRTVTVHSITNTHIKGKCHTRQAQRTFRVDRIVGDLTDCGTGEIMSPREWEKENSL
ncbi:hypothetical protein [Pseudomonas sp. CCOS 191]|uniref:hypothetical protein n=1 Tax=Pseudomonas sp. CCOS 191 TaxID=1649877 RepID=UPI0012DFF37A|nr:hypothetical protein [Pseudomonas sp. CCOS 191]